MTLPLELLQEIIFMLVLDAPPRSDSSEPGFNTKPELEHCPFRFTFFQGFPAINNGSVVSAVIHMLIQSYRRSRIIISRDYDPLWTRAVMQTVISKLGA